MTAPECRAPATSFRARARALEAAAARIPSDVVRVRLVFTRLQLTNPSLTDAKQLAQRADVSFLLPDVRELSRRIEANAAILEKAPELASRAREIIQRGSMSYFEYGRLFCDYVEALPHHKSLDIVFQQFLRTVPHDVVVFRFAHPGNSFHATHAIGAGGIEILSDTKRAAGFAEHDMLHHLGRMRPRHEERSSTTSRAELMRWLDRDTRSAQLYGDFERWVETFPTSNERALMHRLLVFASNELFVPLSRGQLAFHLSLGGGDYLAYRSDMNGFHEEFWSDMPAELKQLGRDEKRALVAAASEKLQVWIESRQDRCRLPRIEW